MHNSLIDKFKFCAQPPLGTMFTQAVKDDLHLGVIDKNGNTETRYKMSVGDSLYADCNDFMKMAIGGSIESLYIIFGFQEPHLRESALSLDNFYESVCSFQKNQLEKYLNTGPTHA